MPRVVLVDDDPAIRGLLRPALERQGIDIIGEAADGIEAVEVVRELSPDVVLMDVQMPGMTGIEACREIKTFAPNIQIVFVTVYDHPHPTRSAEEVGAYAYLLKDSSFELVRDVVMRAANLKQELDLRGRREA
jgi:DNA-binding NarL/FixJ family response regulator